MHENWCVFATLPHPIYSQVFFLALCNIFMRIVLFIYTMMSTPSKILPPILVTIVFSTYQK